MGQIITVALSILSFLAQNRETIKQTILDIEQLIPNAAGSDKAAAVKNVIGAALNIETQIEAAWPIVTPIFNLLVATVKTKPADA